MRIAVAGLSHETNQYVPGETRLADFEVSRGPGIFARFRGRTYVGGIVAAAQALGHEVVGAYHAIAQPGGPIQASAYAEMRRALIESIQDLPPVDAVVLELHGAGVCASTTDIEGDLLQALRHVVGAEMPLVVAHDLHANLSQAEIAAADLVVSVKQYPHDDAFECGVAAMQGADAILRAKLRPVVHLEKLPLLIPPTTTYHGPGQRVVDHCLAMEDMPGVVHCTFVHGFPYADHPDVGAGVLVVTDDNPILARDVARDTAELIWSMRHEFAASTLTPEQALREAAAERRWPVILNETCDNPGGGAPADGTRLLGPLLASGLRDAVFVGLKDPDVVRLAHQAGVGATITIELGGKTDTRHGDPVSCTAYVKVLTDGDIPLEAPLLRGASWPLGRTARLVIDDVDVIVFSEGIQTFDRTPLLLHGIDPTTRSVIALKSSHHFRSGFRDIARRILTVDSGGVTSSDLAAFPRSHLGRPMYPLDPSASYGRLDVSSSPSK